VIATPDAVSADRESCTVTPVTPIRAEATERLSPRPRIVPFTAAQVNELVKQPKTIAQMPRLRERNGFQDARHADHTLRRIAVYDDEEQRWSKASIRILEGTADVALPSSRVDALPTFLKAA
jgi:hypothetical protein